MEKITELLEKLENLGDLIPKLDTLTDWIQWLISLAVRVGPVCILGLGLIYMLIPPKEANRRFGYRTYFGMGSVMAWIFTQRVAGAIMTLFGAILTIIALLSVKKLAGMDLMDMSYRAFSIVKGQVICILIIYLFMFLLTAVMFDRKGYCRFPGFASTPLGKLLLKEDSQPVKKSKTPDTFELPDFVEENQDITADDIIIEEIM